MQKNNSNSSLTENEKKIISLIQKDIPVTSTPYKTMADKIDISEDTFIKLLKGLNKRKILRRYGATLKHQKSGYKANAMIAWKVDDEKVESVAKKMAKSENVTHCYKRKPVKNWDYNIYTMVHGKSEEECFDILKTLLKISDSKKHKVLFSKKELKKTSMQYF